MLRPSLIVMAEVLGGCSRVRVRVVVQYTVVVVFSREYVFFAVFFEFVWRNRILPSMVPLRSDTVVRILCTCTTILNVRNV